MIPSSGCSFLVPRRGVKPGQETALAVLQSWHRHMSLSNHFTLEDPQLDIGQPQPWPPSNVVRSLFCDPLFLLFLLYCWPQHTKFHANPITHCSAPFELSASDPSFSTKNLLITWWPWCSFIAYREMWPTPTDKWMQVVRRETGAQG